MEQLFDEYCHLNKNNMINTASHFCIPRRDGPDSTQRKMYDDVDVDTSSIFPLFNEFRGHPFHDNASFFELGACRAFRACPKKALEKWYVRALAARLVQLPFWRVPDTIEPLVRPKSLNDGFTHSFRRYDAHFSCLHTCLASCFGEQQRQ